MGIFDKYERINLKKFSWDDVYFICYVDGILEHFYLFDENQQGFEYEYIFFNSDEENDYLLSPTVVKQKDYFIIEPLSKVFIEAIIYYLHVMFHGGS